MLLKKNPSRFQLQDSIYILGLLSLFYFSWVILANGLNYSWYYDGFPFSSKNYLRLHSLIAIISTMLFFTIYYYTSRKNRFRSYVISSVITLMELSTLEFYWNFGSQNRIFDPYFFSFTFLFLVFGYLNYNWKFFNIDPVLIGLYLFVDSLELIMWLFKFFGLLPSLIMLVTVTLCYTHLAITILRTKPEVELTL